MRQALITPGNSQLCGSSDVAMQIWTGTAYAPYSLPSCAPPLPMPTLQQAAVHVNLRSGCHHSVARLQYIFHKARLAAVVHVYGLAGGSPEIAQSLLQNTSFQLPPDKADWIGWSQDDLTAPCTWTGAASAQAHQVVFSCGSPRS